MPCWKTLLGTEDPNYLGNGNRLLLDLFDAKVELVENLDNVDDQLNALADRLRSNGKKPYLVPIGGSNALGALGYVRAGLELAGQIEDSGIEFRRRGAGLGQCRYPQRSGPGAE